jgi:nucleoside-diphosphate-sugar epimerase
MRVFVTGATGWVGSVVVKELIGAGHEVLGLSRSDEGAEALTAAGASVHRGYLEDLDSLRAGARASDGVIHCAFIHDFSKYLENCAIDRAAIEAIGAVLAGSGRPFITTSGTAGLAVGRFADEDTQADRSSPMSTRLISEDLTFGLVSQGVRGMVVRLPPSVHGAGDKGFVPTIIAAARERGTSAYVGDGRNRWSAVHRLDAARLYRLALESGEAGRPYHAIGDEAVAFGDIAAVIGKRLSLPVVSLAPEEAVAHFGFVGMVASLDIPVSGAKTRSALGWAPTQPGLIADLDQQHYFAG